MYTNSVRCPFLVFLFNGQFPMNVKMTSRTSVEVVPLALVIAVDVLRRFFRSLQACFSLQMHTFFGALERAALCRHEGRRPAG
uniref:Secreted protein n=1 Tax=Panagrellus redivivus TaxID=6233 RepID=A0A7E4V8F1_PANRE